MKKRNVGYGFWMFFLLLMLATGILFLYAGITQHQEEQALKGLEQAMHTLRHAAA